MTQIQYMMVTDVHADHVYITMNKYIYIYIYISAEIYLESVPDQNFGET